jgi:predicted RNase H-like HicB family nuclease
VKDVKIIVEKHSDGYVAYPLGIAGVVVGEGETYEEAMADVKSAIAFHLETFGMGVIEQETLAEAADPEMRAKYSFKGGQRGRYVHLFPQKAHLSVLSPDMAAVFPDSDSVNEALRTLVKAVQGSVALQREREAA